MGNHTNEELRGMMFLIESSIVKLYNQLELNIEESEKQKRDSEQIAKSLIFKHKANSEFHLNEPYGGSLATEEIAEMILVQEYHPKYKNEEAATNTIAY